MKENKPDQVNQNSVSPEIYAAKLAVIAGAITTLGDALGTFAAVLDLENAIESEINLLGMEHSVL